LRLGLLIIVSVYHDGNSPVSNEPTGPIPRVHFRRAVGSAAARLEWTAKARYKSLMNAVRS